VKPGEQDDAVQRPVEGVGGVEVLLVEGAPLGHLGEVRARAHRQLGPRRQQLGAGVGRDLEAARRVVDPRDRHAIDREGAADELDRPV
jgi:hypothetical protein